jgi:hypothetical protein
MFRRAVLISGFALGILMYTNPNEEKLEAAIGKGLSEAFYQQKGNVTQTNVFTKLVGFGTSLVAKAVPFKLYNYFVFSIADLGELWGLGILGTFYFFEKRNVPNVLLGIQNKRM